MREQAERSNSRVLIVDAAPAVRQVLGDFLSEFYRLSLASDGQQAVAWLQKQQIDLLILDGLLNGQTGAKEVIAAGLDSDAQLPIIALSAPATLQQTHRGESIEFHSKKLLGNEAGRAKLLVLIDRLLNSRHQKRQAAFRRRQSHHSGLTSADFLVGESQAIAEVRSQVALAAASDLNVLLTGETGVGKTLVAEAVHFGAGRGELRPFIKLEPSTLPPSLFESELFGHARGAFTGATSAEPGAFEAANGGTLFLDEIGDLDPTLQRKLLRAVEERVIRRVGDMCELHLDVRIITATNFDLERGVEKGTFRADLFQRLNEFRMHIPPLRERREDVMPLFRHFMAELGPDRQIVLSEAAEHLLIQHSWPGNVRELRTLARRLSAQGFGARIGEDDLIPILPARADRGQASDLPIEERIRLFSRRSYLEALKAHAFNIRRAAQALGVPYHTLRSRLTKLELLDVIREGRMELSRRA